MPLSRIEVRVPHPPATVQALISALHDAQCEALRVPADDLQIRYIAHAPEHFAIPPGRSALYTLVEVTLFPGRSDDAKRALYRGIVQRFAHLGIPPDDIFIVLHEPPLSNWAFKGGRAAIDMDLQLAAV